MNTQKYPKLESYSRISTLKKRVVEAAGEEKAEEAAKCYDALKERIFRDEMLKETHTDHAPWTVVRGNDKRRARLNLIRHILSSLDYEGKDKGAIGEVDDKIIGSGPGFLK